MGAIAIVGLPIGGAGAGAVLGGLAGFYTEGPNDVPGFGAVCGAVLGAAAGGLVGVVVAAVIVG